MRRQEHTCEYDRCFDRFAAFSDRIGDERQCVLNASDFRCPRCRAPVDECGTAYVCRSCESHYPIIGGVPDFRVCPDPYISIEEDRDKGRLLAEESARKSFDELIDLYYRITAEIPPGLAARYATSHRAGVERGRGMVRRFEERGLLRSGASSARLIDLGCGTGGFLVAASERFGRLVGVDVAFRWLVVGSKRLAETDTRNATLVAACVDHLPFPDDAADFVVAEGLIEHLECDLVVFFDEVSRVMRENGMFSARTVNRFAPAPEPHVQVWGVGFLPRRFMDPFVRWRKGIPYEHVRLRSRREIQRALAASNLTGARVLAPLLFPEDYSHHGRRRQDLFRWYARLIRIGPLRPILARLGPFIDVVAGGHVLGAQV